MRTLVQNNKGSHPRYSIKKGVLKNFEKFTGENLCGSLFFNKVAGLRLRPEKDFSCNYAKFFQTPFSIEHLKFKIQKSFLEYSAPHEIYSFI